MHRCEAVGRKLQGDIDERRMCRACGREGTFGGTARDKPILALFQDARPLLRLASAGFFERDSVTIEEAPNHG
jgi:hypothetical protein